MLDTGVESEMTLLEALLGLAISYLPQEKRRVNCQRLASEEAHALFVENASLLSDIYQ